MIAPELEQLTRMFDQATAPTFFLFAIAAIVDRMNTRLAEVTSAMRGMVAEGKTDSPLHRLYQDRAKLLRRGIHDALIGAILTVVLLVELFVAAYLHERHAYGAGILFLLSAFMLGAGLWRFAQEARLALREPDVTGTA